MKVRTMRSDESRLKKHDDEPGRMNDAMNHQVRGNVWNVEKGPEVQGWAETY
jgi:hypothetical protein